MTVGVDILEVERVKKLVNLNKIFTDNEINYFSNFAYPNEHICGCFCAKEAVFKCLNLKQLNHKEIEIFHNENGRPFVKFYGETLAFFKHNFVNIDISISHTKTMATAFAIATEKASFTPKNLWFFKGVFLDFFFTSCNTKCVVF